MSGRYSTPAAFKQAVEQRLRDKAAGDGVELSRLRQLLVFDRFLARAFAVLGDRVVLKGGLVIELRLARARTTKDIDLRVLGEPAGILESLRDAGRLDLGDFLQFEVTRDSHHPEIEAAGMLYQGQRYRARALLSGKTYGSPFGVDVAFAEPMAGKVERIEGSRFLAFANVAATVLTVYPIEAHVAEKLHAYSMPRDRPNTRVKDLPDIALLASVGPLEAAILRAAVDQTFGARATHAPPSSLPRPPEAWASVYERIARTNHLPWTNLDAVTHAASQFLDPVLARSSGWWDPDTWTWRRDNPMA